MFHFATRTRTFIVVWYAVMYHRAHCNRCMTFCRIAVARRGEIILTRTAVSHAHQLDLETHSTTPHRSVASFLRAIEVLGSPDGLLRPNPPWKLMQGVVRTSRPAQAQPLLRRSQCLASTRSNGSRLRGPAENQALRESKSPETRSDRRFLRKKNGHFDRLARELLACPRGRDHGTRSALLSALMLQHRHYLQM